jgi:hypothetical protein
VHNNQIVLSTLHQCLKYVDNDKQKRINRDLKPFGVHEIKFNDVQLFLSKEDKKKDKPSELVKTSRNAVQTEESEYDVSLEEEEEIMFHFKSHITFQTKKSSRGSDEDVIFNFKLKTALQVGFSSDNSDEEVTLNLKTKAASQVETPSSEESDESKDSGHMILQSIRHTGVQMKKKRIIPKVQKSKNHLKN